MDDGNSLELTDQQRTAIGAENKTFFSRQSDLVQRMNSGELDRQEYEASTVRNAQDLFASRAKTLPDQADQFHRAAELIASLPFNSTTQSKEAQSKINAPVPTQEATTTSTQNKFSASDLERGSRLSDLRSGDNDSSSSSDSSKDVEKGWDKVNALCNEWAGSPMLVLFSAAFFKQPISDGMKWAWNGIYKAMGYKEDPSTQNATRGDVESGNDAMNERFNRLEDRLEALFRGDGADGSSGTTVNRGSEDSNDDGDDGLEYFDARSSGTTVNRGSEDGNDDGGDDDGGGDGNDGIDPRGDVERALVSGGNDGIPPIFNRGDAEARESNLSESEGPGSGSARGGEALSDAAQNSEIATNLSQEKEDEQNITDEDDSTNTLSSDGGDDGDGGDGDVDPAVIDL